MTLKAAKQTATWTRTLRLVARMTDLFSSAFEPIKFSMEIPKRRKSSGENLVFLQNKELARINNKTQE